MGRIYSPAGSGKIWFYSERGLLAYLFHCILVEKEKLLDFLMNAKNHKNQSLYQAVGEFTNHRILTEFSFGKSGFGEPDGAIFTGVNEDNTSCIFIEGKVSELSKNHRQKKKSQNSVLENKKLVSNSKLEKQLELRWRFLNALEASMGKKKISEEYLPNMPSYFVESDRFYQSGVISLNVDKSKKWRAVKNRKPLDDSFRKCGRRFYLLAITKDKSYPSRLGGVKLFDLDGQPLIEPLDRIYWLSLCEIEKWVERVY